MRAIALILSCLPLLLCGCDFETPPSHAVALPREEILQDLPFHSDFVFSLAWHPEGGRLAVAEHAGASNALHGFTLADSGLHDLRLRFSTRRRFAALPARGLIVGETTEGRLQAWSLQDHQSTIFFPEKISPFLWSLTASGEDLVYVPIPASGKPYQVRYVKLPERSDRLLLDSLRSVEALRILPQGDGVWIAYTVRLGMLQQAKFALYSLPEGRIVQTFTSDPVPLRFAPSPEGKRLAYTRNRGAQTDIMIYDLERGLSDSLISIPRPASDLIWPANGEALAFFVERSAAGLGWGNFELRAYDLQRKRGVTLVQELAFTTAEDSPFEVLLFAVADTLAFFTASRERIGIFDQRNYAYDVVFEMEDENEVRALAWNNRGAGLFLHARARAGRSVFYWEENGAWQKSLKPANYADVSLLPQADALLGIAGNVLIKTGFNSAESETLWVARHQLEVVRVHPQRELAAIIENTHDDLRREEFPTLFVFDLSARTVSDSMLLRGWEFDDFAWLERPDGQLAGVWQSRRERRWPGEPAYGSYYFTLSQRRFFNLFIGHGDAFCVRPKEERVSFLSNNNLHTVQVRADLP